ncbi:cytochrome P450 2C15-like [Lineus longissimus]|uniref:cytochrome P450 2C15-like n=1 Tax=Lineus longissimus TaxID=88925 RepID=UPI002B4E9413
MDTTSMLAVVGLLILAYLYLRRKHVNLPPGPWLSVPILGSIPFLGKDLRKEALRLSKDFHSDVITVKLGPHLGVFLNSYASIKAALSSEDFTDRPDSIFFLVCEKQGVASSDGNVWKEHRRLMLSVLRDMGMGKMAAEEKIREEVRQLIGEIRKLGCKRFDIGPLLNIATANVISATIVGQRYDYHDPEFLHYVTRFKENLTLLPNDTILAMYPSLRHLPGNLFNFGTIKRNIRSVFKFLEKHIKEHKERFDPGNISDFLDAYLVEKERQDRNNPKNTFSDEQLKVVLADLFVAGSETSATTLQSAILFMIAHPEIQRKVQSEIDDFIGKDQIPTMHDRRNLPYAEATVLETYRFSSLAGLGLPHSNQSRDVVFQNFTIPKGTMVIPNIWAIHRDPEVWKYPDVFDPRNFLGDDGSVVHKPELMPFAIGRRQCPGEGLAKMEVFIFFVTLLQKFTFSNPEGDTIPSLDGVFTTTNAPHPFKICVNPRSDDEAH